MQGSVRRYRAGRAPCPGRQADRELGRRERPAAAIELRWELVVDRDRVTLYEHEPPWDGDGEWMRREMAQFRYARREWTLWWGDSHSRWRRYGPCPPSAHVVDLIAAVQANEHGCFD